MTLLRPRLFLAISGAVCLIALVPQWRRPPAELAAIDRSPIGSARVNARLSTTDDADRQGCSVRRSRPGRRRPPFAGARRALRRGGAAAHGRLQFGLLRPRRSRRQRIAGARAGRRERRQPRGAIRLCRRPGRGACGERPRRDCAVSSGRGSGAGRASAAAPAQFRGRDPLQQGRRCGPRGARPGRERPGRANGAGMGVAARQRASVLRRARRLPRGPSDLAEPRLASRPAGSRTGRASPGSGQGRRVFRRRRAADERGKDRRGARGKSDGPQRRGVANHPRLVARRQFRRPDRERHPARLRRFARQGRSQISRRPPALRRLRRRRRARRGACRSRRSGADRGPHRGGARADERRAGQGRSCRRSATIPASCSPGSSTPAAPAASTRRRCC